MSALLESFDIAADAACGIAFIEVMNLKAIGKVLTHQAV
jgi:hypothetical protein